MMTTLRNRLVAGAVRNRTTEGPTRRGGVVTLNCCNEI